MTCLQVFVCSLYVSSDQIYACIFSGNGSGVQWDFIVHGHHSLLKGTGLDFVDLDMSLVPLEGVQSLGEVGNETILYIVVQAEIALDKVIEVVDYVIGVLVKQAFQLANGLKLIEVLFELSVQVSEYAHIVFEHLDLLIY